MADKQVKHWWDDTDATVSAVPDTASAGHWWDTPTEPTPGLSAVPSQKLALEIEQNAANMEPQRQATPLERGLDMLPVFEYIEAGIGNRKPGEGVLQAARRGIQTRRTIGENILEALNQDDPTNRFNPGVAAGAGLMAAIALDPLTYVGIGPLTRLGRLSRAQAIGRESAALRGASPAAAEAVASEAAPWGRNLGEQAALGQRALVTFAGRPVVGGEAAYRAIDSSWERLQRLFRVENPSTLGGVQKDVLEQAVREIQAARAMAEKQATEVLQRHATAIDNAIAKHGLDRADIDRRLTLAVERAKDPTTGSANAGAIGRSVRESMADLPPEAQRDIGPAAFRMVRDVNAINARALAGMMEQGIDIAPLQSERINYMPRIKTPKGAEAVQRAKELGTGGGGGIGMGDFDVITERTPSQKERQFREWDTPSVNEYARTQGLKAAGYKGVEQFFVENPMAATVTHAGQAARSARSAMLLKGYVQRYGRVLPDLSEREFAGAARGIRDDIHAKLREEWAREGFAPVKTTIKGFEEAWLPESMVKPFKRHMAAQVDPTGGAKLLRQYNRLWARYTTSFIATQARNQLGDFYNGYIIGGTPFSRLKDAITLIDLPGHKATREVIELGGKRYTRQEINDLAARMGLTTSTRTEQFVPGGSVLRVRPQNKGEAIGRAWNENIYQRNFWALAEKRDYANRLAMFMDGLDQGFGPEASALRVMEHFFDYAQLGPRSAFVRDYALPFFAWTRYNVPFQLKNIAQRPGIAAGTQKVREFASQMSGDEDVQMGLPGGVPLPRFMAEGLPLRFGANAAGDPQFMRLEATHPLADAAVAMSPDLLGQRALGLVTPLVKTPIEMYTGISTFNSDWGTGDIRKLERFPGQVANVAGLPVPKRWVNPLISAIPGGRAVTELNRLNPFNVFGTQTEPGLTGMVRSQPDIDPSARAMSMLIGRPYAFNVEQEAARAANREMATLREWATDLRFAQARGDVANAAILEKLISEKLAQLNSGQAPQEAKR